jgi:hypothetical protein
MNLRQLTRLFVLGSIKTLDLDRDLRENSFVITNTTPSEKQAIDQDNREPAEQTAQMYDAHRSGMMLTHWDFTKKWENGYHLFEMVAFNPTDITVRESNLSIGDHDPVLTIEMTVKDGREKFTIFGITRLDFIRALLG